MDSGTLPPLAPLSPPWRVNAIGWPCGNIATANDLLRRLVGDRSVEAVVGGIEAFVEFVVLLAVISCFYGALGGSALFNALVYNFPRIDRPDLYLLMVGWAFLLTFSARSAAFFLQAMEAADRPIPLSVARRWLDLPAVGRPAVAGWWWGQAVSVWLASHWIERHTAVFPHPTWTERVLVRSVGALFWYGAAVAMNTSVLIGVAAFTGDERIIRRLWRVRLAVDLLGVATYLNTHARAV